MTGEELGVGLYISQGTGLKDAASGEKRKCREGKESSGKDARY